MGTSVNQSSPRTLNWSAARSGYRDGSVPVERLAAEVWRAATNQPVGNLADLLARPIIATLGELVSQATSSVELARKSAFVVAESKQASLGVDIARRAAMQSFGTSNPFKTYSERLFSEATSYLVARDLPGYVGVGRVRNVAESLELAADVAIHVADITSRIDVPKRLDARSWAAHVRAVVDSLRRSGR
jgi:hypothetical protein